jgi:hypothetical protein
MGMVGVEFFIFLSKGIGVERTFPTLFGSRLILKRKKYIATGKVKIVQ